MCAHNRHPVLRRCPFYSVLSWGLSLDPSIPVVTIKNQTSSTLNVAWTLGAPVAFKNSLKGGGTWSEDRPTWPHTFEARIDLGARNQVSVQGSLDCAAQVGTSVAAGAASVAVGTGGALGALWGRVMGWGRAPAAIATAGTLMESHLTVRDHSVHITALTLHCRWSSLGAR
jgi:hypothetical protein